MDQPLSALGWDSAGRRLALGMTRRRIPGSELLGAAGRMAC